MKTKVILLMVLFCCSFYANARSRTVCKTADNFILVGFFNGVLTTEAEAFDNLEALEQEYGYVSPDGRNIAYEIFYNDTNGLKDFIETFAARAKEKAPYLDNNFAMLWDLLGAGKWWQALASVSKAFDIIWSFFLTSLKDAAVLALEQLVDLPTQENYAEHNELVRRTIAQKSKMIFVAHSQGNLFANQAYEYAQTQIAATANIDDYVRVVHVAPASIKTNGPHVLSSTDLVIKPLLMSPGSTHTPKPLNKAVAADPNGHNFLNIYMNKELNLRKYLVEHISDAMKRLEEKMNDIAYDINKDNLFTARLIWGADGDISDADLLVYEPDGALVYYTAPANSYAGNFLRKGTFNTYSMSCDKRKLKMGTYRFQIKNPKSPKPKSARFTIKDYFKGELFNKAIKLNTGRSIATDIISLEIYENYEGAILFYVK